MIVRLEIDIVFSCQRVRLMCNTKQAFPLYNEIIQIHYFHISGLFVTVADCQTQKSLVNYTIPVTYLSPFHQYHLELNKVWPYFCTCSKISGSVFQGSVVQSTLSCIELLVKYLLSSGTNIKCPNIFLKI